MDSPVALDHCLTDQCQKGTGLKSCGACKFAKYCSLDHQKFDRPEHKVACQRIAQAKAHLDNEEAALRAAMPDVFTIGVGQFYNRIPQTQAYMQARHMYVVSIAQITNREAITTALEHAMDMLRLNRVDNTKVREIVPFLLIRLGRDQDAYDFMKWWITTGRQAGYDWYNATMPFLDVKGADVFEPITKFVGDDSLCFKVALALIKLRLYMDLGSHESTKMEYLEGMPLEREFGNIVPERVDGEDWDEVRETYDKIGMQWRQASKMINTHNKYYWDELIDETAGKMPSMYTPGSKEEAQYATYYSSKAWLESMDEFWYINDAPECSQYKRYFE